MGKKNLFFISVLLLSGTRIIFASKKKDQDMILDLNRLTTLLKSQERPLDDNKKKRRNLRGRTPRSSRAHKSDERRRHSKTPRHRSSKQVSPQTRRDRHRSTPIPWSKSNFDWVNNEEELESSGSESPKNPALAKMLVIQSSRNIVLTILEKYSLKKITCDNEARFAQALKTLGESRYFPEHTLSLSKDDHTIFDHAISHLHYSLISGIIQLGKNEKYAQKLTAKMFSLYETNKITLETESFLAGILDTLYKEQNCSEKLRTETDENGDTLLHHSVRNFHPNLTKNLLIMGWKYDKTNKSGITPIQLVLNANISELSTDKIEPFATIARYLELTVNSE